MVDKAKRLLGRWKTEYDFKTYITAAGSLAVTLVFAFYNGFLGIHHASLWHGTICVYYLVLTILRGSIIADFLCVRCCLSYEGQFQPFLYGGCRKGQVQLWTEFWKVYRWRNLPRPG